MPRRTEPKTSTASNNSEHALYNELRQRLQDAGCFSPAPWAYGIRVSLVVCLISFGYFALLTDPHFLVRIALATLIAFATVQAGFIAHDAGDGAVTNKTKAAFMLRHGLMSFVSALSSSYFHYLHKVHHLTLQRGGRGLASGEYVANPYEIGWLKRLVSGNGTLFLITTVCLRGLTFKLESLRYIVRNPNKTKLDAILIGLHALCWLIVPAAVIGVSEATLNYALITLIGGPYVGTILVLNHEGMATAKDQGHLPMIERVTRSTRNLGRSWIADAFFGGVNNHIEHHLFPKIPGPRLPEAREVTRDFCREHGIGYTETKFWRALAEAAGHFRSRSPDRLAAEALS